MADISSQPPLLQPRGDDIPGFGAIQRTDRQQIERRGQQRVPAENRQHGVERFESCVAGEYDVEGQGDGQHGLRQHATPGDQGAVDTRIGRLKARQLEDGIERHTERLVSSAPRHDQVAGFVEDEQRQVCGHPRKHGKGTADGAHQDQDPDRKDGPVNIHVDAANLRHVREPADLHALDSIVADGGLVALGKGTMRSPAAFIWLFMSLAGAQELPPVSGLPHAVVLRRIPAENGWDLVVALSSAQPCEQAPLPCWWTTKDRLGILLADRGDRHQFLPLAIEPGPNDDCSTRVERFTVEELVLSCTGEKWATYDNQKFVYDMRARKLVAHFSYPSFSAESVWAGPEFVMKAGERRVGVEIDSNTGEPQVTGNAAPGPPQESKAVFGQFHLSRQKSHYGEEYSMIAGEGNTYPLAQTKLQPDPADMDEQIGPHQVQGGLFWFGKSFYNGEGGAAREDSDTSIRPPLRTIFMRRRRSPRGRYRRSWWSPIASGWRSIVAANTAIIPAACSAGTAILKPCAVGRCRGSPPAWRAPATRSTWG